MTAGPYLLDTTILIEFFSHSEETVALLPTLKKHGALFTSLLSVAEIRMGWSDKDASVYLPVLYDLFPLQPLTKEIAEQAGGWRRAYHEKGVTLSTVDTLIAAIAYHNHLRLVTASSDWSAAGWLSPPAETGYHSVVTLSA